MPKTYYNSELTAEQIEDALTAIDGVVNPGNNGKVLYIEDGKIKAASASRWSGGAVLEPLNVTANGDYTPPTGTDGFDSVHVAVPGATLTTKSITQNGTYNASSDNADGYSSVTVAVPGGATVEPLEVTQNGTYNPPSGVNGFAPVTVNVSGGGDDPFALTNYIQSSGTQWIDTGYIPTLNTRIEIVAKVPNTGIINCLVGVRDVADGGPRAKAVIIYAGAASSNINTLYCQFSGSQDSFSGVMANFFGKKTIYRIKRGNYLLADGQWNYNANTPSTGSSVTSTRSLYLFALHNVDSVEAPCPCFLYRARFYENDTLAMELLPWVDGNNVVCLKDTISGNLIYNSGTGDFVYGTDA